MHTNPLCTGILYPCIAETSCLAPYNFVAGDYFVTQVQVPRYPVQLYWQTRYWYWGLGAGTRVPGTPGTRYLTWMHTVGSRAQAPMHMHTPVKQGL